MVYILFKDMRLWLNNDECIKICYGSLLDKEGKISKFDRVWMLVGRMIINVIILLRNVYRLNVI